MARPLTVYIVFHRDLFPENTAQFTDEEIKETFVWAGVNEDIVKVIPPKMLSYPFVYEYKMKVYSPWLQRNHFYQNSFLFHLFKNPELIQSRFVGFGQYDMGFPRKSIPETLEDDHVYGYFLGGNESVFSPWAPVRWQTFFLDPYNKFYNTSHTFESLFRFPLFFYHTFIIPTSFFMHIMPFIELDANIILQYMGGYTRHISGTLERVFALCIAAGLAEGRLKKHVLLNVVEHLHLTQRCDDPVRNITSKRNDITTVDTTGCTLAPAIFTAPPGREHYRLLKYLGDEVNNAEIFDIGTWMGASALALACNKSNIVHSFDLEHKFSLPKRNNIVYHLENIVNDTPRREQWKSRILASPLIFLDIDPHEGKDEYIFYEWLRDNQFKGALVCDDIHLFDDMRNNFWSKIPDEYKTDLTSQGHHSGTGVVRFTNASAT